MSEYRIEQPTLKNQWTPTLPGFCAMALGTACSLVGPHLVPQLAWFVVALVLIGGGFLYAMVMSFITYRQSCKRIDEWHADQLQKMHSFYDEREAELQRMYR